MIEPIEPIKGGQGRTAGDIERGCFIWCPIMAVLGLLVICAALKACGG